MAKIWGQLERAQLENLAADPSGGVSGRVFFNATDKRVRVDDGVAVQDVPFSGVPASNVNKLVVPAATKATLDGLTRVAGNVLYATDEQKFYGDDGGALNEFLALTQSLIPAGTVCDFAGASAPSGWELCYGQGLDTTAFSGLFAVIGYTYGGGGSTFNVPDLRGRVRAGKDNMGGSAANRVTAASGITGTTLGATGGAETHVLTEAQMPLHSHGTNTVGPAPASTAGPSDNISDGPNPGTSGPDNEEHTHQTYNEGIGFAAGGNILTAYRNGSGNPANLNTTGRSNVHYHSLAAHTHTMKNHTHGLNSHTHGINPNGSSALHQNMPPTMIMNAIIKT